MHGEYKMPGGKLVVADLEVRAGKLAQVQISGDFFLEPDTALAVIDAALEGLRADVGKQQYTAAIQHALDQNVQMYGVSPEAVAMAVQRALETSR
ncbi:MAG TPA: biotin--protein ligase [Rhodanobacteraceae bacterium]|nr:biotin--protein ligase [Rhodanobacteraceae bacterium]